VNSSINIQHLNSNLSAQLFIEIGTQSISFVVLQETIFTAVVNYIFLQDGDIIQQVNDILSTEKLLLTNFKKVDIIWVNKESVLVPPAYYSSANAHKNIELVYGDVEDGLVKTDFLYRHNIHNVYKVNAAIEAVLKAKFPFANSTHKYAVLPDIAEVKGNKLYVVFYNHQFVVTAVKENKLQLIQQFNFEKPEDVSYYLLAIIQQYKIEQAYLIVSGAIDTNSALYSEIYKYFTSITLATLPSDFDYVDEIKQQPAHYFSHLFFTATCV
jgi:hypothetical protein